MKDNRTNFESPNPEKYLMVRLDDFLEQSLYQINENYFKNLIVFILGLILFLSYLSLIDLKLKNLTKQLLKM